MFNESYHLVLILLVAFFIGFAIAWQIFGQKSKEAKEQAHEGSEKTISRLKKKVEKLREEKLNSDTQLSEALELNKKEEKDFESLHLQIKKQQFRIDELKVQEGTMHNQLMEAERFLEHNIGLDEHNEIKENLEAQISEKEAEITELKEQLESLTFKLSVAESKKD